MGSGDPATATIGVGSQNAQRMGAFIERLLDGHRELLGSVGAAISPAHESFTLQEHLFGFRLNAENFCDCEADGEQTLRQARA